MMTTVEATSYLETRAYNEGIDLSDLLDMTPGSVSDDAVESAMFWQERDYSHKLPVSLYPLLADDPDNAMPEDPSVNRSRGNDVMTIDEEVNAMIDNGSLAARIDAEYTGDDYSFDFYEPMESPFFFI